MWYHIYVSKYERLLNKVKSSPKHTSLTELIKLMELVGFAWRRGSKNHYIFYCKLITIGVAPPHSGRFVKPIYVRNCLKAINEVIKNDNEKR